MRASALVKGYSSCYVPYSLSSDTPAPLSNLFKADYLHSSYYELLQIVQATKVSVMSAQALIAEEKTRSQHNSHLWHQMRRGRITASRLKAVCSTDPVLPSTSLIISICHPELSQFKSAATTWGCKHESEARAKYKTLYNTLHSQFSISDCGLFLHLDRSFMGASPDALVSCLRCGEGICEFEVVHDHCMLLTCLVFRTFHYCSAYTRAVVGLLRMLLRAIAQVSVCKSCRKAAIS